MSAWKKSCMCYTFRLLELLAKLQTSQEVVTTHFAYFQDGNVHQIVWNTIGKYVGHLTEDEIFKARREFCCCVNSIIDAYQEKLHEVRALKNTIEVWKEKSHDQRQKIKGLERRVDELTKQLASKVCDDCGEKRITEQMGSMSMQENKSESEVTIKSSVNCIDHKVKINQNFLLSYVLCCFCDLT